MIRLVLIVLLLASAALAQQSAEQSPTIEVSLDPADPVTVGTPVDVAVTVLVPSYMPQPPVWPDLQIADAITLLPDRATVPVTRRIGRESWSGLTRTYEITPQRAADFDLGGSEVAVTYAAPDSNDPRGVTLPLPHAGFTAVLPEGAEGLDPFIAAQSLTLTAKIHGLPDTPKRGDAFTFTLATTATGTRAMLLPPMADRLTVPAGLRAYPRQPELADTPGDGENAATANRTEEIAFVIETPGSYTLPAQSLEWWNTATSTVETATTDPISVEVAGPSGGEALRDAWSANPLRLASVALLLLVLVGGLVFLWYRRHRGRPVLPPGERQFYRQLLRTVRRGPVQAIRPQLRLWLSALSPVDPATGPEIEAPLHALERAAFGREPTQPDDTVRDQLLAAIRDRRRASHRTRQGARPALPGLNPDWGGALR